MLRRATERRSSVRRPPLRVRGPRRLRAAALAACLALAAGCGDGGGLAFEAPSEDELRDRVHLEANAILDAETLPWALEQAQYAAAFATAFLRFTQVYAASFSEGGLLTSSGLSAFVAGGGPFDATEGALASEDGALATAERALTYSASGYIDFSCPGADVALPDYTFSSGFARVESPGVVAVEDVATVEAGAVFRLTFQGGCAVGGDVLGGDLYGLFETPWVLAADVRHDLGGGDRPVRADFELAANRFTVIIYDDAGDRYKMIVTHPDVAITSARVEGANAKCWLDIERDPESGGYRWGGARPDCER